MSNQEYKRIPNLRQTAEKAVNEAIGRLVLAGIKPTRELISAMIEQMAREQVASDKQNGIRRV